MSSLSTKTEMTFKNDTIEFDEAYFLLSRKGRQEMDTPKNLRYWRKRQIGDSDYQVKLFFTYGRNSKNLELYESHMGRTSKNDLERYFTKNKFKNVEIFTDSHPSYKSFFKNIDLKHDMFIAKEHVSSENKLVHNQTINAYMRNFKNFVNKDLRGVSTKYLGFYSKWFQFLNTAKENIKKELVNQKSKVSFNIIDNICNEIIVDKLGLEMYRQSEKHYKYFLKENGRTDFGTCKHHYYHV